MGKAFISISWILITQALHMPHDAVLVRADVDDWGGLRLLIDHPDIPDGIEGASPPECTPIITVIAERHEWDWNIEYGTDNPG